MCDDQAEAGPSTIDAAAEGATKVSPTSCSKEGEDEDRKVREAIFAAIPPYRDSDEEEACRSMVASLTEEERERAARTSYAYFAASSGEDSGGGSSSIIDPELTTRMAMRMARRHIVAENGDVNVALARMRDTLRFREEVRIDDVRRCLAVDRPCDDDDDESDPLAEMRSKIKVELHVQPTFVRGYDRSDRAILIKAPRGPPPPSWPSGEFDEEGYVLASLHVAERALACTERRSLGRHEKIVVALDYADYASANVPPIAVLRRSFAALQRHYPERLHRLVIVDAPFFMRGIWAIVSPLLDADTVEKVKFVTGDVQKEQVLGPLIAQDQAMPFLLPGGELTSPVDVNRLITGVPFDRVYDDDV